MIEDVRLDKQKQFGQKPESFSVIFRSSVLEKPIQVNEYFLYLKNVKQLKFRLDIEALNKIQSV